MSASRVFSFLAAVWLASATAAAAETADDLVAKNLAARGGAAKLASIASIEFTGKLVAPGGFELAYKETRARKGNAARVESSIEGLTLVQGFDGHTGWRINPFEGRRDAERMSDDDTLAFADDATIDGALLLAKAGSGSVTYLGREDFDGTDTYKLLVVKPDGARYTYFLDPDTYLEVKVVEERERRGSRDVTLFELGDYELVDGVYFPFEIEAGSLASTSADRQQIRIASAQANVPAPDSLFAMPVTAGAK
jgi:hypothetical protein